MEQRKGKMSESELGALVQYEIQGAIEYDRSDFKKDRVKALEYFRGEMRDLMPEEGRSSMTSRDVSDTIGWMLPGLMRVFFASDTLGMYEPEMPDDDAAAKQATDYVNYVLMRECDGYQVFWDVFHDALLHGNGVVKHWWEEKEKTETKRFSGLSEEQVMMVLFDPSTGDERKDIEVVEKDVEMIPSEVPLPPTVPGMPQTSPAPALIPVWSLKVKRTVKYGCLKVAAVAPEEFLISIRATDITNARFVGQRMLRTRSEAIQMGFKKDEIYKIPTFGGTLGLDQMAQTRNENIGDNFNDNNGIDPSTEQIELIECYLNADKNGDGIAERLKVTMGGGGSKEVLHWEEWEDEVPFTDFVMQRIPHRYLGHSVFNDTMDIAQSKTVLLRQGLDNMYQSNIPDRFVKGSMLVNPDQIYDRSIGNVILLKPGAEPDAVRTEVVPFVAQAAFEGMNYMDQMIERRTGVSRSTMGLDMEALQNQSATAVNAQQSAAYSKIELIARNFAEMGFKRFFRCILKIIVANQDKPKTIRLRDKWVEMDPRDWNANMDFNVNVGLGSGSQDKDAQMLAQIITKQETILAQMGPQNPIVTVQQYAHSLRKFVELTGTRNPDQFFSEANDEAVKAWQDAQAQQKDPKVAIEEQKLEAKKAEGAANIQIKQQTAQADIQAKQQKNVIDMQAAREKNEMAMAADREKNAMEMQQDQEKHAAEVEQKQMEALIDAELRREEMDMEFELTREANHLKARTDAYAAKSKADTNIKLREGKSK